MGKKVALVTGSSKGIGAAIAKRLAEDGFYVVVTYYRDQGAGEAVCRDIGQRGGSARLLRLDVKDPNSVGEVFQQVEKEFGVLNVLVNNAVQEIAKNLEDVTFDEWRIVTGTKIDGTFLCTKYALPLMKGAENANVVMITSYDGVKPVPDYIGYCVGTAGIIAFAKAMALYLPRFGVRVNWVSPGATRTPLWDALGGDNEEMWENFARSNPMGRNSTPEDVAEVVSQIVMDQRRFLNGNHVYVDGGNHLRQA